MRPYDVLREAVYPWSLPFDLAQAEVEAFLKHLGTPWAEVLEVCGVPSVAQDDAVAYARLGLTSTAARIIAGDDVGQPAHVLWGVDAADWWSTLEDAPQFLERAQLDLAGFGALAATSYAGGGQLELTFEEPCQLQGATVDGLDASRLSRTHRFVRLQRALGWTMAELDTAITALGSAAPDPVDGVFVRSLSRVLALHGRFSGLPRRELLAWFGDLSTIAPGTGGRSHYEEVFVEVTAQGDPSPLAVGQPPVPLADVMPQLAAALSRTEDEVATLLTLDPTQTTSTVPTLSWLHRYSSLARALTLDVRELVTLVELSGQVPFAVLGAGALDAVEGFVRLVERGPGVFALGRPSRTRCCVIRAKNPRGSLPTRSPRCWSSSSAGCRQYAANSTPRSTPRARGTRCWPSSCSACSPRRTPRRCWRSSARLQAQPPPCPPPTSPGSIRRPGQRSRPCLLRATRSKTSSTAPASRSSSWSPTCARR